MQLSPGFHQSSLPPGKFTGHEFDGVQTEYRHIVLVVGVQVRQVVRPPDLDKHTDDDTEESAQFRHATPPLYHAPVLRHP